MKSVSTRALAPKTTQALLKSKHPHDKQDIQDLIATLRSQYEEVKAQAAFLNLKQFELRPGDEISFFGYLQAKEQLYIEQSLLFGHAFMARQILAKRKQTASPEIQRTLRDIETATYCRSWPGLSSS